MSSALHLRLIVLAAGMLLGLSFGASPPAAKEIAGPLDVIAFGSCNKETTAKQPIWKQIAALEPDLWIWTGDIIYGNTDNLRWLRAKWDLQKYQPDYTAFRNQVPIIGTWDDHDFGKNNAGKNRPDGVKAGSQKLLLDFLDEPADSPRRHHEGVYTSYVVGPADKRVKIFLLDNRFHRDPPRADGIGDILGEEQWAWFEYELGTSDAQINLIANGIQIVSSEGGHESWGQFPDSRRHLFDAIHASERPGVILLSGDRHFGEISRLRANETPVGYPIYDITSSGLTHYHKGVGFKGGKNPHRVGDAYIGLNFGMIQIDWDANPVEIRLQLRDQKGELVREQVVMLDKLQPPRRATPTPPPPAPPAPAPPASVSDDVLTTPAE